MKNYLFSGKSTVMRHLEKLGEGSFSCYYEPIELWTNYSGINLLEQIYSTNPGDSLYYENNFNFQTCVLLSLLQRYDQVNRKLENSPSQIIILERSFLSTYHVFLKASLKYKTLSPLQHKLLSDFTLILSQQYEKTNINIGLICSYQEGHKRWKDRGRKEEVNMKMDYYNTILDLTKEMIVKTSDFAIQTDGETAEAVANKIYKWILERR